MEQQLRRLEQDDVSDRKSGLGGSDSPIVLNVSPFKTRKQLWQEKLGLVDQQEETAVMKRGHYMEDKVADMWEGVKCKQGFTNIKTKKVLQRIVHPKFPFIMAHLDRIIEGDPRGPGVLEIKCPGSHVANKVDREGMQEYYIVQLQHYLGVTGLKWGVIVVLHYDDFRLIPYEATPNKDLIKIIFDEDVRFWEYVQSKEEPPEPEVKLEKEDIVAPGEIVNMDRIDPQLWAELVKSYGQARALVDEAEAQKELAEKQIKFQMENAGASVAEGAGARVFWKEQAGKKSLDKKAFAAGSKQAFEIYESYLKTGKPSRPFRFFTPKPIYKE
jgi:putative phage-type endonuclease